MNDLTQLKTDFIAALTANLDATTRTKLMNRFMAEHQSEYDALVAGGMTNNATNRGIFAVDKVFAYIQGIYTAGSRRELIAAQPPIGTPETMS